MKSFIPVFLLLAVFVFGQEAIDPKRAANSIVLDEVKVQNLRIETVEVEESEFKETVFALGRVESIPSRRSGVSSRTPGRIVELKLTLGDQVTPGMEVAKLESRQFGDPPPVIPLKAQAGGLVTKLNATLGEPLEPEANLMEITDLSEVYAVARVPEHLAGKMKSDTMAAIKVTALPEEPFEGELLRFGTEADRASGTIDAIFKLPNPNLTIRPGMRAEFSIILGTRQGVLSVPRAAIQGEPSNRFVYVKSADPKLKYVYEKSPVVLGAMNDRYAEILSGVLVADEVVTRGAYSLSFAGASSVSLKEALDAAHGHEHAEDGSELTPEKKAEMEAKKKGASGGAQGHSHAGNGVSSLWMYSTAILGLLLVVSFVTGKKNTADETGATPKPNRKEAA